VGTPRPHRCRKRATGTRAPITLPARPNQRWSLDFVSDCLDGGRRFRVLVVVDDCTRACLALVADTSLSGVRVARELDAIIARRGAPAMIVSDNSLPRTPIRGARADLAGDPAMDQPDRRCLAPWGCGVPTAPQRIAPGKPQQNAFAESFIACPGPDPGAGSETSS
jgi:putative transposase